MMNQDLHIFNEWWTHGKINPKRIGKERTLFREIIPYIKKRQIILLTGIRRVGKTTLFYQVVNYLLKKEVLPYSIFYLSFDEPGIEVEDSLKWYFNEIIKSKHNRKIYIFFDEIHKAKNWENTIKKYYDLYPNLKFFITGSASLISMRNASESLAGRIFSFKLETLEFSEFLNFRNIRIDKSRIPIYFDVLYRELKHYLLTGGFPELTKEKDYEFVRNYIKEMVFERIIYRDIPGAFNISEPELLSRLLQIISSNPGMLVDFKSLSSDLSRDWRTIENYLNYLNYSFLIRVLKNYSPNLLTTEKKLKKFYPASTSFSITTDKNFLDREDLFGRLVETLLIKDGRFFYRSPSKQEVDLILEQEDQIVPIEIKWKSKLSRDDINGLLHFMRKFNLKKGILITKDLKDIIKTNDSEICCIPIFDWLILRNRSLKK